MNPLKATFEDYQAQYDTILPLKAREVLTYVQIKVRHAVAVIDESVQIPEFVLRIGQFVVAAFSLFPSIDPLLEGPKQFCKDVKNFTNVVKGMKSVDGFLHFKFHWKSLILNISGLTLFIVSSLSLIDRFNFYNVTPIKISLTALPILGILPWGGLLPLSVVGLMGMISLFAIEKMGKLQEDKMRIKSDKLSFWSVPFDLAKVQENQLKYQTKILDLKEKIAAYEVLIEKGTEVEDDLIQRSDQSSRFVACQKALSELSETLKKTDKILKKVEQKSEQWNLLEKNWSYIDSQEVENFRQAKQAKWEKKLEKIECEKRATMLSISNSILILARQALVIVSVATGYGIVTLPFLVNIGLDAYVAGTGMMTFFMKRSIKKIKIPSEDLATYINLNVTPGSDNPTDIKE